jgi:hypothetical protein
MSKKSEIRKRKAAALAANSSNDAQALGASKVLGGAAQIRKPPAAGMGRKKGVPNKTTRTVREMMAALVENNLAGAQALYDKVSKKNPVKALEILARFAEFVLPKLNRTELQLPTTPISSAPITPEDASRVYAQLMHDTSIDLSAISFVSAAPQPLGSEWNDAPADPSIVVEVPAAPAAPADKPSNIVSLMEKLNK